MLETFDGGVHGLAGSGKGTCGQYFDLLCMSNLRACVDDFLSGFLELLSEVSELQHLTFDKRVTQLLYGSVNDGLVWLSELEDSLAKGTEGGLRPITRPCAQLDCEYRVSFTHGKVCAWAGVVEYESYVFGLAFVIVSVVDGHGDAESSVGLILDEWRSRVRVSRGIVNDVLIRARNYYWGCR